MERGKIKKEGRCWVPFQVPKHLPIGSQGGFLS